MIKTTLPIEEESVKLNITELYPFSTKIIAEKYITAYKNMILYGTVNIKHVH